MSILETTIPVYNHHNRGSFELLKKSELNASGHRLKGLQAKEKDLRKNSAAASYHIMEQLTVAWATLLLDLVGNQRHAKFGQRKLLNKKVRKAIHQTKKLLAFKE